MSWFGKKEEEVVARRAELQDRFIPRDEEEVEFKQVPVKYRPPRDRYVPEAVRQHYEEMERINAKYDMAMTELTRCDEARNADRAEIASLKMEVSALKRLVNDEHARALHYERYSVRAAESLEIMQHMMDKLSADLNSVKPFEVEDEKKEEQQQQQQVLVSPDMLSGSIEEEFDKLIKSEPPSVTHTDVAEGKPVGTTNITPVGTTNIAPVGTTNMADVVSSKRKVKT